jgi:hypothetical protein
MSTIDRTRRQPSPVAGRRGALVATAVGLALAALAGLALLAPVAALAKGGELEAWLDRPLPTDAAPGTDITIGFLLADAIGHELAFGGFPTLEVRPADGSTEPVTVAANQDWTGHFVAEVEVPAGGLGEISITIPGSACDVNGCRDANVNVPVAGTGLPPGVPLQAISSARITRPDPVAAGETTPLEVILTPNPGPDPAAFPAPERLYLSVIANDGTVVDSVPVTPSDADPLRYTGSATFDTAGGYRLRVSPTSDGNSDDMFSTIVTRLVVVEVPAPAPVAPAPVAPAPGNASPSASATPAWTIEPVIAIVGVIVLGVAVLVVGAVIVMGRRPLATPER